jgi:pectin methylesterase-like acyl-CoA thioesterase
MRNPAGAAALSVALLALLAPPAVAGEYDPGTVPPEATRRPEPSGRVLRVGRDGIQAAVDRARAGDTIRVPRGSYRGPVEVRGASKRGLLLVGDGATIRGSLTVRDTAAITVRGVSVVGGSVLVRDVDRYVLDRVRVSGSAGNGIDARRSPGGALTRVLARANAAAGIALGGSPPRVRAARTFVRDSTVEGNRVGIALDALRAVTISRVRVLGSATGVAARDVRDGVLTDSDIVGATMPVAGDGLLVVGLRAATSSA